MLNTSVYQKPSICVKEIVQLSFFLLVYLYVQQTYFKCLRVPGILLDVANTIIIKMEIEDILGQLRQRV